MIGIRPIFYRTPLTVAGRRHLLIPTPSAPSRNRSLQCDYCLQLQGSLADLAELSDEDVLVELNRNGTYFTDMPLRTVLKVRASVCSSISVDCKRGRRQGTTSRNVKNRQKVSKSVKKFFDNFRAGQRTSNIVKKCQKVFRHFSTIFARHHFSGPLWGAPSIA